VISSFKEAPMAQRSLYDRLRDSLDHISSVLILVYILVLLVSVQFEGSEMGIRLGFVEGEESPNSIMVVYLLEHVFVVIFVIEAVVRLVMHKSGFFLREGRFRYFNTFDLLIVVVSCLDLYVFQTVYGTKNMPFSMFRVLRLLRVLRSARVLMQNPAFRPLRVVLTAIYSSLKTVFWSMVVLTGVMSMAALFVCQTVAAQLDDSSIDLEARTIVFLRYGTMARAVWTFFQLTFSGGWPGYVLQLVNDFNHLYAVFFFVYIVVVVFTMFRIVTAIFVRDSMAQAAKDHELAVQQKLDHKKEYVESMLAFFHAADSSGDGVLSSAEFHDILANEKVTSWLNLMDIDIVEATDLFSVLAGEDDKVSLEEFKRGILHVKGHARSEDVVAIKHHCVKMWKNAASVESALEQGVQALRRDISQLEGQLREVRMAMLSTTRQCL